MTETVIASDIFTKEQCESTISFHSNGWNKTVGTLGTHDGIKTDSSFRQCMVYLPPSPEFIPKWMGEAIINTISDVNKEVYDFDLGKGRIQLNLLRYDSGGHYKAHTDVAQEGENAKRKISFTMLLNDSYEGGKLNFFSYGDVDSASSWIATSSSKIGDMILFPSYSIHKVEPVTSGIRWALVGWCLGDKHFV